MPRADRKDDQVQKREPDRDDDQIGDHSSAGAVDPAPKGVWGKIVSGQGTVHRTGPQFKERRRVSPRIAATMIFHWLRARRTWFPRISNTCFLPFAYGGEEAEGYEPRRPAAFIEDDQSSEWTRQRFDLGS
jgi:hypothetical protein